MNPNRLYFAQLSEMLDILVFVARVLLYGTSQLNV